MGAGARTARARRKRASAAEAAMTEACKALFDQLKKEIDQHDSRLEAIESAVLAVAVKLRLPM